MQLLNLQSGQVEEVPDAEVTARVASGGFTLPKGAVEVVDPDGQRGTIDAADAQKAFGLGYQWVDPGTLAQEAEEAKYGNRPVAAFTAGVGRSVTLGLSDVALEKTGLTDAGTLEGLQKHNEGPSVAGEVVGAVVPALIPGGQFTAAGAATRLGLAAERVAAVGAKTVAGRLAAGAVGSAVEGGLYGLGGLVTEKALHPNAELTGQQVLSTVGLGAVLGGLGGVAGKGLEEGASKLRSLVGEKAAAELADAEAKAAAEGQKRAATETASKRGKYGSEAAKASNLLETGNQLLDDAAVSAETRAALNEKLAGPEARELRAVTAKNVLEDFDAQAGATLNAKAAYREAADTEGQRAGQYADEMLSGKEALEQVKARLQRYAAPLAGSLIGGAGGAAVGLATGNSPMDAATFALAGAGLRPAIHALRRMVQHPAVKKLFWGTVQKALEATPEAFGHFAPALSAAAATGADDLVLLHGALSSQSPEYRDTMQAALGLNYGPDTEAGGDKRSKGLATMGAGLQGGDARLDKAVTALLDKRPKARTGKPLTAEGLRAHADELANLVANPDALTDRLAHATAALGQVAPDTSAALMQAAQRGVTYLHQVAPKAPTPALDVPALRRPWAPSDADVAKFEKRLAAVTDPYSTIEDAAAGRVTREAVEALQAVYPELLGAVRDRLLERLASHGTQLDYQQRLTLGTLFGKPLDDSAQPQRLAALQALHQAPQGPPPSRGGKPPHLAAGFQTDSERLASRRQT